MKQNMINEKKAHELLRIYQRCKNREGFEGDPYWDGAIHAISEVLEK